MTRRRRAARTAPPRRSRSTSRPIGDHSRIGIENSAATRKRLRMSRDHRRPSTCPRDRRGPSPRRASAQCLLAVVPCGASLCAVRHRASGRRRARGPTARRSGSRSRVTQPRSSSSEVTAGSNVTVAVWLTGFASTSRTPGRRPIAASTTAFSEARSIPLASITTVARVSPVELKSSPVDRSTFAVATLADTPLGYSKKAPVGRTHEAEGYRLRVTIRPRGPRVTLSCPSWPFCSRRPISTAIWIGRYGGWGVLMILGMVLFWALVLGAVVWLLRELGGSRETGSRLDHDPLKILDRRLADGSITPDDYRERRAVLTDQENALRLARSNPRHFIS